MILKKKQQNLMMKSQPQTSVTYYNNYTFNNYFIGELSDELIEEIKNKALIDLSIKPGSLKENEESGTIAITYKKVFRNGTMSITKDRTKSLIDVEWMNLNGEVFSISYTPSDLNLNNIPLNMPSDYDLTFSIDNTGLTSDECLLMSAIDPIVKKAVRVDGKFLIDYSNIDAEILIDYVNGQAEAFKSLDSIGW